MGLRQRYLEHERDDVVGVLDAVLGQVDVDTEEGEPFGAAALAGVERVDPAARLQLRQQTTRSLDIAIQQKSHKDHFFKEKKKHRLRNTNGVWKENSDHIFFNNTIVFACINSETFHWFQKINLYAVEL